MNKQKILIVDDDENIAELVSLYLTKECFDTMMVHDGERALVAFDTYKPNLILLDLMLPGIDGYQVCREIRTRSNTPIIMLSAKGEIFDKVLGLELGADDYITKPFDMEEVLARIESNLRRIQFQNSTPSSLKCNDLVLDLDGNRAMLQGAELPLTAKEFAILELLMKYPDKIFSKANLFQSVWNTEYISEDNTLNVHISNLRNKMKAICPDKEFIDTVWGIGYRLHKAEG